VAGVIASMRAQGQSRTAGIYQGNVYTPEILSDNPRRGIAQAWSPAAAVAACQKFIGQRPFRKLLFTNGLPWVFVFGGLSEGELRPQQITPANTASQHGGGADTGTLVVLGDLGAVYDRSRTLFRSVSLAKNGGSLTIPDGGGQFVLYDFYGNPVPSQGGKITVPLNGLGYFLRTIGATGSFGRLIAAVEKAEITGYAPVEIVAHDLTAPISEKPTLRLTLTNVYNRPVAGALAVTLGDLALRQTREQIVLGANQTKEVTLPVAGGTAQPDNLYPLHVTFNAGGDGTATHEESLRVEPIAKRNITVDGNLDDWNGHLPQPILAEQGMGESLTERAYLPFLSRDAGPGAPPKGRRRRLRRKRREQLLLRGAHRRRTPVRWQRPLRHPRRRPVLLSGEGVREREGAGLARRRPPLSYRKDPDLPRGTGRTASSRLQRLPTEQKSWLPYLPGTMPRFMVYEDTDYEFALNEVAAALWRRHGDLVPAEAGHGPQALLPAPAQGAERRRPGHRRQAGGEAGGGVRIVECSIPWSRMPEVKARIDAGRTVKFSFRVNDDKGPAYELAVGRSVSKENSRTFHNDWSTHWANELEFALEKYRRSAGGSPGRDEDDERHNGGRRLYDGLAPARHLGDQRWLTNRTPPTSSRSDSGRSPIPGATLRRARPDRLHPGRDDRGARPARRLGHQLPRRRPLQRRERRRVHRHARASTRPS
jgi:hypothetical protein